MSKAVMISIRPKWCEKVCNGEKTIEVRKTRPKLQTPFKCYIYCTMDHPYISVSCGELDKINYRTNTVGRCNGKVIGEFVCDDIAHLLRFGSSDGTVRYGIYLPDWRVSPADKIFDDACLTRDEAEAYLGGLDGWAWRISGLRIYDTPYELSEFTGLRDTRFGAEPVEITRPPQSWRYVEELSDA